MTLLPTAFFGVVMAYGIDNRGEHPRIRHLLDENIQLSANRFASKKVKEDPAILPYREAFRALGINPNKYLCSIEALFTGIAKGKGCPHINPVVDAGNAISLQYTLPIGAHDLEGAGDDIRLRFSQDTDTFLPFKGSMEEAPALCEVVYAVGSQIQTRRWSCRQSEHGKSTSDTSSVFFPIDGFSDFNADAVLSARDELSHLLIKDFGCRTITGIVDAQHRSMVLDEP